MLLTCMCMGKDVAYPAKRIRVVVPRNQLPRRTKDSYMYIAKPIKPCIYIQLLQ